MPKPPIPYQFISPNDLGFDFSFASGGGHNMEPHCFIRNRKPVTPPTQWRKAEPPPSSAPPAPPFDIETMETIEPPWQAIKEWIPDDEPDLNWFNQERPPSDSEPDQFDQSPAWQPEEVPLGDGRTLVLEDF